jgi:hypothetical protein
MPIVFWMTRLKPEVRPEDYEKWLKGFIANLRFVILSIGFSTEQPFGGGEKLFDYWK